MCGKFLKSWARSLILGGKFGEWLGGEVESGRGILRSRREV